MSGFLIAGLFTVWVILLILPFYISIELNLIKGWVAVLLSCVIFTIGTGIIINSAKSKSNVGPCVSSEVQMHFNPATKTIMPARVCTNRGVWIKDNND